LRIVDGYKFYPSTPGHLGASGDLIPSDYFSDDGGILIVSDSCAFNRGESWRTWGSASVMLSLSMTLLIPLLLGGFRLILLTSSCRSVYDDSGKI
jgi:hypothetical protein